MLRTSTIYAPKTAKTSSPVKCRAPHRFSHEMKENWKTKTKSLALTSFARSNSEHMAQVLPFSQMKSFHRCSVLKSRAWCCHKPLMWSTGRLVIAETNWIKKHKGHAGTPHIIREVRWVRCPGSDRTSVSPVRTEPDEPQKRLGES